MIPVGEVISLPYLQGALRFAYPGIPAEQKFELEIAAAIEDGWIEVGKDGQYRRIGPKRSQLGLMLLRDLETRIEYALRGITWID
jgi:hypothetical protein